MGAGTCPERTRGGRSLHLRPVKPGAARANMKKQRPVHHTLRTCTPPPGGHHMLAGLADEIASDGAAWRSWYELDAPEAVCAPEPIGGALGAFERLLLLRCLRIDRVTVGVTRWVMGELGERYVTPPVGASGGLARGLTRVGTGLLPMHLPAL